MQRIVLRHYLPFTECDHLLHQFADLNYAKVMSLRRCKERNVDFTFASLQNSLENISAQRTRVLCQVRLFVALRSTAENELQCKLHEDRLREVPTDDILEEVSNHIGSASLALGVELGLEVPILESIEADNKLKLLAQTRQILQIWKKLQKPKPTILILMKTLERIGKAGCIQTCIT